LKICKKDFALAVMGVFCGLMNNQTRPTPETDEQERIDNGDTHPLLEFARNLERERDEAREELARMQTMAASVADIIAKRDAMIEVIRWAHDALKELRSFYIETTGLPPCAANAVLEKLKTFLP
jgi:hypothetical protein